jgi:paraquat-inducible protein A
MGETPPLLICEHCDTVYRRRPLAPGEVARCERCHAVLERHQRLGNETLLALVLTAMVAFVVANAWPVVTLGLNGQQVASRLWGAIAIMWRDGAYVVAVLAAGTLFFFPLAKMLLLGWVLLFAREGRRAPGFVPAMRALHYLQPWTMTEVFVLGVLVSIVKASMYFDVVPGVGAYAYGVLTVLITLFSGVDLRRLWDLEESLPAVGGRPA